MVDLDTNGILSQDELNLYSFLTSYQDLSINFQKCDLTKKEFIELHQIEINDISTDLANIMRRLSKFEFKKSLKIDHVSFKKKTKFKFYSIK